MSNLKHNGKDILFLLFDQFIFHYTVFKRFKKKTLLKSLGSLKILPVREKSPNPPSQRKLMSKSFSLNTKLKSLDHYNEQKLRRKHKIVDVLQVSFTSYRIATPYFVYKKNYAYKMVLYLFTY